MASFHVISTDTYSSRVSNNTFTNITEPNTRDGARAAAVNTLYSIGADDHILNGSTILEDEDGFSSANIWLNCAADSTVAEICSQHPFNNGKIFDTE